MHAGNEIAGRGEAAVFARFVEVARGGVFGLLGAVRHGRSPAGDAREFDVLDGEGGARAGIIRMLPVGEGADHVKQDRTPGDTAARPVLDGVALAATTSLWVAPL